MRKLPGAIFIIDPKEMRILQLKKRNLLNIPVIAITDTNCDPDGIDYVVPGNDDAVKSISLFTDYFSHAVTEGGSKVKRDR
jgi:small subunit ribosomal protein S2